MGGWESRARCCAQRLPPCRRRARDRRGYGQPDGRTALSPQVGHVTALDSAVETLAIATTKVAGDCRVSFVHADVFDWSPPQKFDIVVFGFWLSHVPPGRFEAFWAIVDEALRPGGRVFFTDNAVPIEQAAAASGRQVVTPWSQTNLERGVSVRTLADGRQFQIVKRVWRPVELERELATIGWSCAVTEHQGLFIHGEAVRRLQSRRTPSR